MKIRKNIIPVNNTHLIGNEKKYLIECINSNWISSEGQFVKRFENNFTKKIGKKYAVAVSSGTAALQIAFDALNFKKNDEIILPTFTIVSCLLPIIRSHLKPVFIDSDPYTWNMNVEELEKKITKKTKAILVCHIYGLPTPMDRIIKLAKKYKLKIIEDAAEAHGLIYNNKYCGSFGDISIFSFYANKLITTGEGGMLLTDNYFLADKMKNLRNLYFGKYDRFLHNEIGWNYRMTNIQAALGCAQLEKWNSNIIKKKQIGSYYQQFIHKNDNLQLPLEEAYNSKKYLLGFWNNLKR